MKFGRIESESGYILPLVLGLILAVSLLLGSLWLLPGAAGWFAQRVFREATAVYEAESAILADLNRFPSGYFKGLPSVEHHMDGPWEKICTIFVPEKNPYFLKYVGSLCVVVGSSYSERSFREWLQPAERYKAELRKRLLESTASHQVSGNKRIFGSLEGRGFLVRDGDLRLDSDDSISVANFYVEGNVIVAGSAIFDTLRVYATGLIQVEENVHVGFGELVGEQVTFSDEVTFRGVVVAAKHFCMEGHAMTLFPSFVVAFGVESEGVELLDKTSFEGVVGTPAGMLHVEKEKVRGAYFPGEVTDSAMAVLPRLYEGEGVVWAREVLNKSVER